MSPAVFGILLVAFVILGWFLASGDLAPLLEGILR